MKKANPQLEHKLPVTAELGGEGGSFGDATAQAETFTAERGNERIDPKRVAPPGGEAAAAAEEGEQVRPADDSVKPPSEPPERPNR